MARRLVARVGAHLADWFRYAWFIVLERVAPTRRDHWCFCTWNGGQPHTLDNPRGVFEEIKNDPTIVKVILLRRAMPSAAELVRDGTRVIFVPAESLRGAYYLAISRIVIVGYALSAMSSYSKFLTRKHKIVQLSHGIALKRIGRLYPPEKWWAKETPKYSAAISSSEADRDVFAGAYAPIPRENVWLTGLPRNDLILKPAEELPPDYKAQLERVRARVRGRRLVLYAPTWRQSGTGMFEFRDAQRREMSALMARHGAVFGIRAHANRRTSDADPVETEPGIVSMNDFPDVNVVLRETDVLVTDFSSLYMDFMLTDRPIIHFIYDERDYVSERGFLYDLERALTGAPAASFDELVAQIDVALASGILDRRRYEGAKHLFHSHGPRSARQVAERIRVLSQTA